MSPLTTLRTPQFSPKNEEIQNMITKKRKNEEDNDQIDNRKSLKKNMLEDDDLSLLTEKDIDLWSQYSSNKNENSQNQLETEEDQSSIIKINSDSSIDETNTKILFLSQNDNNEQTQKNLEENNSLEEFQDNENLLNLPTETVHPPAYICPLIYQPLHPNNLNMITNFRYNYNPTFDINSTSNQQKYTYSPHLTDSFFFSPNSSTISSTIALENSQKDNNKENHEFIDTNKNDIEKSEPIMLQNNIEQTNKTIKKFSNFIEEFNSAYLTLLLTGTPEELLEDDTKSLNNENLNSVLTLEQLEFIQHLCITHYDMLPFHNDITSCMLTQLNVENYVTKLKKHQHNFYSENILSCILGNYIYIRKNFFI